MFSKKKIGLSSFDCSLIDAGYSHGGRSVKPVADVNKAYNTKWHCYFESTAVVRNNALI